MKKSLVTLVFLLLAASPASAQFDKVLKGLGNLPSIGGGLSDAKKILNGSDTAATDYFKSKTTKKLQAAFLPSVTDVMNQVGVNRQYNDLIGKYKDVPFSKNIIFDVNQYVTEKATDGVFYVVAQEEKKIRTNPAARVTDLLKEVFGSRK